MIIHSIIDIQEILINVDDKIEFDNSNMKFSTDPNYYLRFI